MGSLNRVGSVTQTQTPFTFNKAGFSDSLLILQKSPCLVGKFLGKAFPRIQMLAKKYFQANIFTLFYGVCSSNRKKYSMWYWIFFWHLRFSWPIRKLRLEKDIWVGSMLAGILAKASVIFTTIRHAMCSKLWVTIRWTFNQNSHNSNRSTSSTGSNSKIIMKYSKGNFGVIQGITPHLIAFSAVKQCWWKSIHNS